MTLSQTESAPLQIRSIRRNQVQQQLAISSVITVLAIAGCSSSPEPITAPTPAAAIVANPKVPALFYSNIQQCQADAEKQKKTYDANLKAYNAKKQGAEPIPPALESADCSEQMAAAKREHDRHAPIYQSLTACQAEGIQCETTSQSTIVGYRPRFGGVYLYPYESGAIGNFAGNDARVYQPHTVYQGANAGQFVTPQGKSVAQARSGLVSAPQPSIDAPARPAGHAAEGTIRGRSQSGFGSTFKSTGSGGK